MSSFPQDFSREMYDKAIADNDDRGDWLHFSTNRFNVIQNVWSNQNSTRLLTAQWTGSSHYHLFACLICQPKSNKKLFAYIKILSLLICVYSPGFASLSYLYSTTEVRQENIL